MANVVPATVIEIVGQAWVRYPDGVHTALRPGSRVCQGEIVTDAGSSISLLIDGGAPLTLGENSRVAFTRELSVPTTAQDAAIRVDLKGSFKHQNQLISALIAKSAEMMLGDA